MSKSLIESLQLVPGFVPVNMQTAANTGDWVSMKNYSRMLIIFQKGIGTAGDDPTITLQQSKVVAGSSPKALNINRVDKKQATDITTVGQYTTSTPAAPATNDTFSTNTWTNSDLAEQQAVVAIEVKAEDLDIDGGYDCVQASVADIGTHTQLGCILYAMGEPRNAVDPLPSAIID